MKRKYVSKFALLIKMMYTRKTQILQSQSFNKNTNHL